MDLVKCLRVAFLLHLHEDNADQGSELKGVRLHLVEIASVLRAGGSMLLHQTETLHIAPLSVIVGPAIST